MQNVSAELIISPNNLDFQVLDNQIVNLQVTIYNNYTFPIYNVSLTELPLKVISDKIQILNNQTSAIVNITVQSNEPFQASKNAKIIFFMKAIRQEAVSTIQVNITRDGFLPRYPVIIKGSTIKWNNQDNIIHSVTSTSFDQNLNPNQEFSYAFNTEGEYPYHDTHLGYYGSIFVINSTVEEYVYFPDYAVNFPLNLNIFLHQTDLTIELMESNLSCGVGIGCETVVKLTNPTNVTALNISISGATANKNNFDLNGNSNTFVLLKILPTATTTLETNATRIQELIVSGLNFPTITQPISFYLPYFDLDGYNSSQDNSDLLIQQLRMFCALNPNSLICNQTRKIEYVNNTKFIDRPLPYNYTQQDIHDLKYDITDTRTKQEELNTVCNALKDSNELMYKMLINMTDASNIDRQQREDLTSEVRFLRRALLVVVIIAVLLAGTIAFLYFYGKEDKEQNLMGDIR